MLSSLERCLLVSLFGACLAFELQKKNDDVQSHRGIGLEEVVLFLIGLGVASALGLAIVIGPLFALFYSSINGLPYGGINGGNTISTTAGGSRGIDQRYKTRQMLSEKFLDGIKFLDEALKKYDKI